MKNVRFSMLLLFVFIVLAQTYAQDAREKSHSMNIIPFIEEGIQKYYVTWSSSSGSDNGWQHDIYNQIISFTPEGEINYTTDAHRFIGTGSDEAQEPVQAAINPLNNSMLSVWEDGSGSTVDVRGELHKPDGTIIRNNWIISGGDYSQHSPDVVYLRGKYLVSLTNEAPPAQSSMNVVKILNDETGEEISSLELSPRDKDQWWAIAASNNDRFSFFGWGDGEEFFGSIIKEDSDTLIKSDQRFYISGIDQYYYSTAWLENLSKFVVIAKVNNNSVICLIDTNGTRTNITSIPDAPITRDTEIAVWWDYQKSEYQISYTSGARDLAILNISDSKINLEQISKNILAENNWTTTGISCQFVYSINGKDLWNSDRKLLIVYNDENSNNAIYLFTTVEDLTEVNDSQTKAYPYIFKLYNAYPNPFNPTTTIKYIIPQMKPGFAVPTNVVLKVYDILGNEVATLVNEKKNAGKYNVQFDASGLTSGVYLYKISAGGYSDIHRMLLLK